VIITFATLFVGRKWWERRAEERERERERERRSGAGGTGFA